MVCGYYYEIVQNKLINSYKIEGLELGRTEGRAQGEKSKQIEIARNFLQENIDINIISRSTGLNIQEINDLKV